MANLPRYSPTQCHQLYDRIQLPTQHRHEPGEASAKVATSKDGADSLAYLTALQRASLQHIPFENLELHYSHHRTISIDPSVIFDKIVTQGTGRGGYCMENNLLFATFLRSLGFEIFMTGAKVSDANHPVKERDGVTFTGYGHQVTIVTIAGKRYLVDIGFGNGGPGEPMLLEDGAESVRLPPNQKGRMVYVTRPGAENAEASKVWVYERTVAGKEDQGWLPTYCFPDSVEFSVHDFGVMNHYTSTARTSFFTYSVICSKFIAAGDGDGEREGEGEIVGHVTLFNDRIRIERKGEKETVAEFSKEGERVKGLEEWLGVRLSEVQRGGIRGMVTALPSGTDSISES